MSIKHIITIGLVSLSASFAIAQESVKAGVYNDSYHGPDSTNEQLILSGKTTFFRRFRFSVVTFQSGKGEFRHSPNDEQIFIVKEGKLKTVLNDKTKIIGRGGVVHILPGEIFTYYNAGKTPLVFYYMEFQSQIPEDSVRGKTNGGSVVIGWEDVEKKTTDKGFSRVFYNHPTSMTTRFDMHATTLKEGIASHAPHTHAEEEIVLMLRGKGKMNIDGKFYDVAPGQLIFLSSGISHAIENAGPDECEYFAFQWK